MQTDNAGDKTNAKVNYEAKQVVCYKSNGKRSKAQILKKHLDDELEPFYTIMLPFGKEKQTDGAHLDPLEPAFERIEEKLLSFSAAQLQQVENFLSGNMTPSTSASSALPSAAMPEPKTVAQSLPTNSNPVPSNITPSSSAQPPAMGNPMAHASMMNRASSNTTAIPSPIPDANTHVPSLKGIPAPSLAGPGSTPVPSMQQTNIPQQQQLPQMHGQMQGQNPTPQMMPPQQQQQLPQMGQYQQPIQGQQPPQMQMNGMGGGQPQMVMMQQPMQGQQMQGQMGGQSQMMMQQQPMQGQPQMMMQQQPMQGQNQMGQAQPAAPQGNPFDMY